MKKKITQMVYDNQAKFQLCETVREIYALAKSSMGFAVFTDREWGFLKSALREIGIDVFARQLQESRARIAARKPRPVQMPAKPVLLVKYFRLQEGFAQVPPFALYNVIGGDDANLIGSTRTLQSLVAEGFEVKEAA